MTTRDAIYRAFVQRYDAATGVVSCTIPKLYGRMILTARPAVGRSSEIASISPPTVNSVVFVFFDGGADNSPFWIPRVLDSAYSDLFVNVSGDTMTGALFGTDITLSGAFVSPSISGTTLGLTGALNGAGATFTGDVAVNGGDLTTTSGTATLFNTGATTLNIGGAATTVSIGAGGGTVTVPGDVAVNGGDLTTTASTATLFNTNATTVNIAQAATTISIGAVTGSTSVRNNLAVTGTVSAGSTISTSAAGTNEQATLQVTGSPSGGTFTLFIAGVAVTLNHNSSTASTESAVNAALGAGSVTVSGGSFPGSTQTLTFTGSFGGALVPNVVLAANSLTGGSSPTVNITYPTVGVGALSATSVSGNNTVSGTRAVFEHGNFQSLNVGAVATAVTFRTSDGLSSAIVLPATTHVTSERAGITIGDWVMGQDVAGNGTKDFFVWNGVNRLSIAPTGEVAVGTLTASSINSLTVRSQDGTNEGGEIALAGAGVHSPYHIDQFQNTLRFLKNGLVSAAISSTGTVGANHFAVVSGGNYYIDGDGNFQRYTHTGDFADAPPYWAEGPLLVGNTGWSFYHGLAGSPRMGFRGNGANNYRYLWCADGTLLGQGPTDSAINAIVNVWGRGGASSSAIWFQDMPGNPSGATVVNAFGNLYQFTSRGALKNNIVDVAGSAALARLMAARPREFTFKPDKIGNGNEFTPFDVKRGFIAEEIAEVDHTYAVWGWVTEDDRVQTDVSDVRLEEAVPTSWDSTAVVADLVAAVQHLTRRITALEG